MLEEEEYTTLAMLITIKAYFRMQQYCCLVCPMEKYFMEAYKLYLAAAKWTIVIVYCLVYTKW